MGWKNIPDIDTPTSTADDNPFVRPKLQTVGKVLVNMPVDHWLCKKMDKLNVTLVDGYPSHSSEAGSLLKDQFSKPARSQAKWYSLHIDIEKASSLVTYWYNEAYKLNSSYSHTAKVLGIFSAPPASRQIS